MGTGLLAALLLGDRPETVVLSGDARPDRAPRPSGISLEPARPPGGAPARAPLGAPVSGTEVPGTAVPGTPAPGAGGGATTGEGAVAAWIELTVHRADRTAAPGGTVYLLPPGEPGTDDLDEIPHAALDEDGRALVPVPLAGAWDVGYAGEGQVLLPDVRVGPGETARLGIVLPDARPIRFRVRGEVPETGTWVVSVASEGSGGEEVAFPGRGQEASLSATTWLDEEGKAETEPLPPGRRFQVAVSEGSGTAKSWLEAGAASASPGDEVVLAQVPLAQLAVRVRREGLPPEADVSLQLVRPDSGFPPERIGDRDSYPAAHVPPFLDLALGPGRARVVWSGSGIEGGTTDDFRLECGHTTVREVVLRARPAVEEPPADGGAVDPPGSPRWRLEALLPDGSPVGEGRLVLVLAAISAGTGSSARAEYFGYDPASPEVEPTEGWPAVREILGVAGPGLASEPASVGADGRVRIALRPGGLLAVVPERLQAPGLGALTVEREDGRPIPVAYAGESSGSTEESWQMAAASLAPRVGIGTILGPFPEGPYRFRVRVGRRLVAEVSAAVKAGTIQPLVIPR